MEVMKEVGMKNLEAYVNYMLILIEVRKEYKVQHEDLIPYDKEFP